MATPVILNIVNSVNELWSIYRSIFLCKNEEEAQLVFVALQDKGYPVTRDFIQPDKYRILVNTWESFDTYKDIFDFSEFNVLYTTEHKKLSIIKNITTEYKIKCIAII